MSRYERVSRQEVNDDVSTVDIYSLSSPVPVKPNPLPKSSYSPSLSSPDHVNERRDIYHLAASFEPDDDSDNEDHFNERSLLSGRSDDVGPSTPHSSPSSTSLHRSSFESDIRPQLAPPSPFVTAQPLHTIPSSHPTTDGVFANLNAKPDFNGGEYKSDELPPSYDVAAADAAPPYWETTIITPGMDGDEVFIDGIPVGNFFAFVWNAMISMSFQFVGFLLTYLLASTHAARNGSRAGLGVILVQYGFYLRDTPDRVTGQGPGGDIAILPDQPESSGDRNENDGASSIGDGSQIESVSVTLGRNEWLSYLLMVVGWFILIRAIGEYYRVKQLEKAVRATPTALGAPVAVVAEGEGNDAV